MRKNAAFKTSKTLIGGGVGRKARTKRFNFLTLQEQQQSYPHKAGCVFLELKVKCVSLMEMSRDWCQHLIAERFQEAATSVMPGETTSHARGVEWKAKKEKGPFRGNATQHVPYGGEKLFIQSLLGFPEEFINKFLDVNFFPCTHNSCRNSIYLIKVQIVQNKMNYSFLV